MKVYLLYLEESMLDWIVLGVFATEELAYNYISKLHPLSKLLDMGYEIAHDQVARSQISVRKLCYQGGNSIYHIEPRVVIDK